MRWKNKDRAVLMNAIRFKEQMPKPTEGFWEGESYLAFDLLIADIASVYTNVEQEQLELSKWEESIRNVIARLKPILREEDMCVPEYHKIIVEEVHAQI